MSRTKLRFGGYQPETSVHTRAGRLLAETLGGPGGAFEVEFTGDVTQAGHQAADLLAMVERGDLDLCYFASSYLAGRVPALIRLDLPFQITTRESAYAELDGVHGAGLAEDVASRTGFRVLAFWDNGFRHISNRLHAIRHPADCRGLSIRTLDNALHHEIFRAFGFRPVTIDVKNLAEAVATHAVDAQENPLTNLVNFGIHRTHRHVSLTAHFFGVALLLVNRERFDSWPEDIRQAIRIAAAQATIAQRAFAAAEDERCLALLREDGVEIVANDAIDHAAFRDAVAAIVARETKGLVV